MYLKPKGIENYWALDIETDDLHATLIHVLCVRNCKTGEALAFHTGEDFNAWHREQDRFYVTHNGISFDIPVVNRLWLSGIRPSRVVDTLVLGILWNPALRLPDGYVEFKRANSLKIKGPHSLDAWGFRLGDRKIQFDDWSALTPEMIEYCHQDCAVTVKLYKFLVKQMNEEGFSNKSAKIEHHFRRIIDQQEKNGFKFNRLRANMFYLWLREQQYVLEKEIHEHFPPELVVANTYKYRVKKDGEPVASFLRHKREAPKLQLNRAMGTYRTFRFQRFNIGSPKQRVEKLLGLGWKPTDFTPKGAPKIDEAAILAFADSEPRVLPIAKWLVFNGRANMVRTWLNNLNREDDCIHGRVNSCGASTRRCTHSAPNSANIPGVEAAYGHTARGLWTARPKRLLVGADASGLEGRVFIHYLGSKEAEEFMLNDPHSANAAAISKAVGFEVSRNDTKGLFYARLYGAFDKKLGQMVGGTISTGGLIRAAIDGNIPGFNDLVEQIEKEYNDNRGRILCIDGGYVTSPSAHSALNYKFQSCGAIIMKQAAVVLTQWIEKEKLDVIKVGDIHDEWQYDCHPDHAERLGFLACESMTKAGELLNLNIKIEGEYSVGRNWAETH